MSATFYRPLAVAATLVTITTTLTCAQEPVIGGTLIVAQSSSLTDLDPHATTNPASRDVIANIFESVITVDETGEIIPQLAQSFEGSDDALTFTFDIRVGVPFHNGDTLTVEDVIASWERMKASGVDRDIMSQVDTFERVDDDTVAVHMAQPDPTFLERLSSPRVIVAVMPEEIAAPNAQFEPVGTGPFKFAEMVADSHVSLTRFEDYEPSEGFDGPTGYGGKRTAYLDEVIFRNVPEQGARLAGILTGDYHIADQIAPTDIARLEASDVARPVKVLPWGLVHQSFNATRGPGADPKFRKAIQIGLDYETLMDFATGGNYMMVHGFQYQGFPYYSEAGLEYYNIKDVDRAKELLAESSYSGEPVVILTMNDQAIYRDYAVALQDQLRQLGINGQIEAVDTATWIAMLDQRDAYDIRIGGYGVAPSIGPYGMLPHYSGAATQQGIVDEELNDAAERTRTSLSAEDRKKAFAEYQGGVLSKAYGIIAGAQGVYSAVNNQVHGYTPSRVVRAWDVWID